MRVALDTNILAYADGVNGSPMQDRAIKLISSLPQDTTLLPVQVLGELFSLLLRRAHRSAAMAHKSILGWRDACSLRPISRGIITFPYGMQSCFLPVRMRAVGCS